MDLQHLPVWNEMKTITLDEMSEVKLMSRIDTKYLIPESLLPELLECVKDTYRVQIVAGHQVSPYQTLYYDTKDLSMYLTHHNGRMKRKKIRARTYLDSDLSFLEVKRKDNKGRTRKKRIKIPPMFFDQIQSSTDVVSFLKEIAPEYPVESLVPQVYNRFERITLVNNEKTERLTIDANIQFKNFQTGVEKQASGFMIVELKQNGKMPSRFKDLLKSRHIPSKGFSKYCLGTIVTNSTAKRNAFKRKLHNIERITKKPILT